MIISNWDHSTQHVLEEMRLCNQYVPLGGYMIVRDTNIKGHPVLDGLGASPMEAVEEFLTLTSEFVIDKNTDRFFMTSNPNGFLRRVRPRAGAQIQSPTNQVIDCLSTGATGRSQRRALDVLWQARELIGSSDLDVTSLHLHEAVEEGSLAPAHYPLGDTALHRRNIAESVAEFSTASEIEPGRMRL